VNWAKTEPGETGTGRKRKIWQQQISFL